MRQNSKKKKKKDTFFTRKQWYILLLFSNFVFTHPTPHFVWCMPKFTVGAHQWFRRSHRKEFGFVYIIILCTRRRQDDSTRCVLPSSPIRSYYVFFFSPRHSWLQSRTDELSTLLLLKLLYNVYGTVMLLKQTESQRELNDKSNISSI